MRTKRQKSCLTLILSTNTNCEKHGPSILQVWGISSNLDSRGRAGWCADEGPQVYLCRTCVKQHTHFLSYYLSSLVARHIMLSDSFVALPCSQYTCCWDRRILMETVQSLMHWKACHCLDTLVAKTALQSHCPPRSWLIVYIHCKSGMTTSGHFADTHGLTGYQPKLDEQSKFGSAGRKSKSFRTTIRVWTNFVEQSVEKHTTSQRRQMLTIFWIYWQGNMFAGRSKAETRWTSNRQASIDELKNMGKELVMKFTLQLHKLPKCLERKCEQAWVPSKIKPSILGLLIKLRYWMRWRVSQATRWKTREEVCSVKQRQNFKDIKGKVTSICKIISRVFWVVLLKDHIIRIWLRQADLVRPKTHQKFSSFEKSVITWMFTVVSWKPKR